jgi:DNA-binding LacI/PurR family transcriptional regulator
MADVAKLAGVSLSTVSHALSGKRPISAEVKQRIFQAIDELGYQPHMLARALATKQTRTIALLYPSLTSEVVGPQLEFVSGVLQATNEYNYGLLLWTAPDGDQELPRLLRQGMIDGLVLMEVRLDDPRVRLLREHNYHFTMIGHGDKGENENLNFVDLDFVYAVQTCVSYLAELDHKRMALIGPSEQLYKQKVGYVVRAVEAYYQALEQHGLEGSFVFCDAQAQAGYEATFSLLSHDSPPTGLIVLNPWIIGGIMRAIHERGLLVPSDISLVGILSPLMAEMSVPPLTGIDFPYKTLGYRSAELLLRQLTGEKVNVQEQLQPKLTVRRSSGQAPISHM